MTTNHEATERWVQYGTGTLPAGRKSSLRGSTVFGEGNRLYSYGHHFELGRILNGKDGKPFAILNGDRYSVTTNRHQADARTAVNSAGIGSIILPFSALGRAGIELDSIRPEDILPDRWFEDTHHSADINDMPEHQRTRYEPNGPCPYIAGQCPGIGVVGRDYADGSYAGTYHSHGTHVPVDPGEDGLYRWTTSRHQLGGSVFSADVTTRETVDCPEDERDAYRTTGSDGERIPFRYAYTTERRWFVSGFDSEESWLYFLAELPARRFTYDAAIESLAPKPVRDAIAAGLPVQRQGDIFAVASSLTTRQLTKMGAERMRGLAGVYLNGASANGAAMIYGQSHVTTETAKVGSAFYGRGMMYHRPRGFGRRPEHRRIRLGDGKAWFRLYRNTVPLDPDGNPRAWTISGSVD